MSFHSTHATSHALQPMQVVTSMYLQTSSSRWTPRPGTLPACPEIDLICRMPVAKTPLHHRGRGGHGGPPCPPWLIAEPLRFLHLHQKPLELGRVGVGIDHRRRQQIH